jgi:phosphatidylserine/phosphatidylglycerophosphate/cardiolipin synthase-like enzyme
MLICVFALTNDTLANAIRDAKNRGVQIKLIFDDEMMRMPGSDVKKLHDEGYEVRVDLDPKAHMHHKFVIIDESTVITGSYNWTRQASNKNHENVVVFEDEEIAKKYIEEFNKLWVNFAGSIEKCLGGSAPAGGH